MFYDHPEYYEVAFSFRDIVAETAFIDLCIKKYSQIEVKRVLEIACGPAPHVATMFDYGYEYTGLDLNQTMLDFAHEKWQHLSCQPNLVKGDMCSFALKQKCDFAYVMLGSLYLDSCQALSNHFDCVAASTRPGSLYFLDHCLQFNDPLKIPAMNRYQIKRDRITVASEFEIRLLDKSSDLYEETWRVTVDDDGIQKHFESVEQNMALFPEEFHQFIVKRNDFEFVGWWSDWDLDKPMHPNSKLARPIVILRRT